MFEDKTYENILNEMLEKEKDVDTSEGSLMYEACAKAALVLEEAYLDMSRLYDNLIIDTMEEEEFVIFAEDRGVKRIPATAPIVMCDIAQEIEIGTRFSCNEYDYTIISLQSQEEETYHYLAKCDTAGTEANNNKGDIEPIDYIEDWKEGVISYTVTYGKEQESIDVYKERFKEVRYKIKSFAGNRAAYREYIQKYNELYGGAADCIPLRTTDKETIDVWVVDSDYKALTSDVLNSIQEYVDPVNASGEGEGTAPIGHVVKIKTPEDVTVNITITVTLESDYTWEGVKDTVKNNITNYLLTLRKIWSKNQKCTVRISQIEYAVLSVEGIIDCTATKINGLESNLELPYTKVPVMGSVVNG